MAINNYSVTALDIADNDFTVRSSDMTDEETGKNYWAVILLVLCVFVVFGNVLVILSVARERLLQNMTNFFIVSLALADLLVAGFVMPFSVYVLVNWGMWGLPKIVCDFYIASDVICSTSSIFNLVAVSVDRYYAVTAPITYSQHKDKHARVYAFIVFCWLASIAIGSPIMLGANHIPENEPTLVGNLSTWSNGSSQNVENETSIFVGNSLNSSSEEFVCAFYNPDFIIYSSLGSFYIPCFVMIFLYGRIFKTLHQRAMRARKAKQKVPEPTKPQIKEPTKLPQALKILPGSSKRQLTVSATNGGATSSFINDDDSIRQQQQQQQHQQQQQLKQPNGDENDPNNDPPKIEIKVECSALPNNCHVSCASSSPSQQQPSSLDGSDRTSSSPPPKPNMAHKACGPDTSLYDRVKTSSKKEKNEPHQEVRQTSLSISTNEGVNHVMLQTPTNGNPPSIVRSHIDGDISADVTLCNNDVREKRKSSFQIGFSDNFLRLRQRVSRKRKKTKSKEKMAARKERKATKTLAIVLGCFLVCWTPFFTCNIINAICIKLESDWHPGDTAFLITTWLGYINSCINPVIYTIFNPEFRKAFKKILGLGH